MTTFNVTVRRHADLTETLTVRAANPTHAINIARRTTSLTGPLKFIVCRA